MALPKLTQEQRQAALEKASEARHARAVLRTRIKSGELSLIDVLEMRGDPVVDRLQVATLIETLPGYGKAKAAKLMNEIGISERCRIKGLGIRQETALREKFGA